MRQAACSAVRTVGHSTTQATPELPAIEQVIPLAKTLARSAAHREADVDDLVQIALFAYHKDYKRHTNVRDPWALARTILQRAMLSHYFYIYPKKGRFYALNSQEFKRYDPIDGCEQSITTGTEQQELFDRLAFDEYYRALEQSCGHTARVLVENLIAVNSPCIAGYILSHSREKLERRARARTAVERRQLPRGGGKLHSIRITQSLIGEAMGLSPYICQREMKKIREFTRAWLGRKVATSC